MTSRIRLLITAAVVCHLLVAPRLVTSQLQSPETSVTPPSAPSATDKEDVTIRSLEQEKDGPIYKLRGQAEVHYGTYVLHGDEITYNSDTGDAEATGNVVLEGGPSDEHVQANHGTYNTRTEVGKFENVVGTIGVEVKGKQFVLTSSNPFYFTGKIVEKTGPNRYLVHHGTVTTCQLPKPKWQFNAGKVVVDVTGDAKLYNSTFRIEGVPIFFFPYATHPVERQRKSGLMVPNIGNSSRKGTVLGESVYWAVNRTMDITAGTEYFSKRGWAPQGEIRARPSEKTFFDLTFLTVLDRGLAQPDGTKTDQGGANVRLDAESIFLRNFRAVASVDYLSSYVFRLAFNEVFTQAVNSEVKSQAFLSNTTRGFSYNLLTQRYQNFESTTSGDVITILHAPTLELSGVERPIWRSPFHWSYDITAEGLSRSEPDFRTGTLVGRFDFHPRLSLPLLLRGWSFRTEVGFRNTIYTQRLIPSSTVGTAVSDVIDRRDVEGTLEIRPPGLERIFDHELWGRKWKHVLEPRVSYHYVTGVDNFPNILRFDARDILSNTNEVEYGIVNRLYAKRTSVPQENCEPAGMPGLQVGGRPGESHVPWEQPGPDEKNCGETGAREIVTWEIGQKYFVDPTFGGALVPGRRNVFTTTADFSGIAFLTDARRLSPLISRLRIQTSSRTNAQWDLDYDIKKGRINASTALLNYRFGQFTIGGGDAFLKLAGEAATPVSIPQEFNQFRLMFGYGRSNKRGFSGAANVGFDSTLNFVQFGSAQMTYNWDCCGINLEYRRFALGQVRNENQFRFSFALANIGAFGNLGRRERLF
jgi:LPS-assembly protein